MLGQRRRRWANIKSSLVQRIVFAGDISLQYSSSHSGLYVQNVEGGGGKLYNLNNVD